MRDRDNSVAKYHEIRSKLLEAQVAEGLEAQRKAERFSLIDPPALPERPARPNRPVLLVLSGVIALAGGFGAGAAAENLDRALYSPRAVALLTQEPPLAVVPFLQNDADRRRAARRRRVRFGFALLLAVVLPAAVHLLWLPLDVVWLAALRKFGL
jgi:hypothetical protein